jgi:adenine-specific DNA methylase
LYGEVYGERNSGGDYKIILKYLFNNELRAFKRLFEASDKHGKNPAILAIFLKPLLQQQI